MSIGCHYFDAPPAVCAPFLVQDECGSEAPCGFVRGSNVKHRKARRLNQGNAGLKNLKVRNLIQKAHRMRKGKVEEDYETVALTWITDGFSKQRFNLQLYSEPFNIGDFKWRILMYSKEDNEEYLSVYLDIPSTQAFPLGWSKYVKFSITLINQLQRSKPITKEIVHVFKDCERDCGFTSLVPLSQFFDSGNGYLMNDICMIQAKVVVRKADAKILHDHGSSSHMESLGKKKERQILSNKQPVNVADISAQGATPYREQVSATAGFYSAPISDQMGTRLPNDSTAKDIAIVSSTSADELMDFRGIAKIEKAFVPLLDEACSRHSSLIECQMHQTMKFKDWAFTALGRVLYFLKTKKVKDMTDDVCAELELLWDELQIFGFNLSWLEPHVGRAMCLEKMIEVQRLREGVDDLETEKKRLVAKLEVAIRELEEAEAVENMDCFEYGRLSV